MKVRLQAGQLGEALTVPNAQSIVIYDDFNQPILLVQKLAEGRIMSTKATDANFASLLKAMGIGLNAHYREVKV